ncbi:DUF4435 domain-containing protein [Pantoea agglomerans]
MISKNTIEPKKLILPKNDMNNLVELFSLNSFVVVGANGCGKTRMGAWLEMNGPQKESVHRIAAQRSIVFPIESSPTGLDIATQKFLWSEIPSNWSQEVYEQNKFSRKIQRKYGGDIIGSENAPVNDFTQLMTLLFSENYASLQKSEEEFHTTKKPVEIKLTKIRKLKEIWEQILPHRVIKLNASEVNLEVDDKEKTQYSAKAMSDGERVIFYLIGHVLCAAENSIIVVDEPEIHIHKAVQDKLWQLLESERSDCLFVYFTHDLGFASSRQGSQKIFMKSYDGNSFDWDIIPEDKVIPETMLLELIGSRKPILFVEGSEGSKDSEVFKLAYSEYLVTPVGGCSSVIMSTKAFSKLNSLHHLTCHGIIDRDYLIEGQISAYEEYGIFSLKVAEIENLFIVPELILAVAKQLLLDENETLEKVKSFVINRFENDKNEHAMNITKHMINLHAGRFSSNATNITMLQSNYQEHSNNLNPELVFQNALHEAQGLINNRNYTEILKVYNKKDLLNSISHLFDVKGPQSTYLEKLREMNKRGLINIGSMLSEYIPALN